MKQILIEQTEEMKKEIDQRDSIINELSTFLEQKDEISKQEKESLVSQL